MLPVASNLVTSIPYTGKINFEQLFHVISKESTTALKGISKNLQGVNMTPREMKALLKTITIFSGGKIPASVLAKDFFIKDIWIEGLDGQSLDDRLRERKQKLREIKYLEGRK